MDTIRARAVQRLTVEYGGVDWIVYRVEYDPQKPATAIDPPHRDFVRWSSIRVQWLGCPDLTAFLNEHTLDAIEAGLLAYFRNE